MANSTGMVQGQVWLLNCLQAALDAHSGTRTAAEDALMKSSNQPGYGVALAKVIIEKNLPLGLRQLAAVLLKQYVKQHWHEGEDKYTPPPVPLQDKMLIRSLLLQVLDDAHGKIRTAVGMAIASIASCDWPEEWPDLMDLLLRYIADQNDMNKVNGALKCLALFSGDLDDIHIPQLVPILFPSLFNIVSLPHAYGPSLRRRALIILHSCVSTLGVMSGVYQAETKALISPMLRAWMEQFTLILSPPVVKTLMQLVQHFPKLASSEFSVILAPIWQTVVSLLKVYQQACVQAVQESFSELADSDGNEQSLESFSIQLFEFLITIVGEPRCSKIVEKHFSDLVYHAIGFMQMTCEQVDVWSSDPNEYVADEDEVTCSCRVSGILLLEELVAMHNMAGIQSVVQSVERCVCEATQGKAVGQATWWKLREAAILAAGTISESLIEAQVNGASVFNVEGFLDNVLLEDLNQGGKEYPFLYGRSLWAAAKFSSVIDERRCGQFLHAAIEGLASGVSPPIKVGACRALSELFPRCNVEVLQAQMGKVLTALGNFLQEASDETLHLVLETLQAAIKADLITAASMEFKISPLVLSVWMQNISDPFISIDALEVLEALKNAPGCLEPLVSRVLPFVGPILCNHSHQTPGLVAGALDLLTMLLKSSPTEMVHAVHDVSFYSVIGLVLQSEDHSELQNATECLATFVQGGGDQLLSWGGDPNRTMRMLLDAAARLLNPGLDSSSSLFVERFITQLIQKLPLQMAQHLKDLVAALVGRMETSEIMGLKNSLLLVFGRLVHMSVPDIGQLLNLLISVPAKGFPNSLAYVMSEWTKQQGEMQGAYQIKLTTTALALILASRHAEISNIYVQGYLIQSTVRGIVTRSQAKGAPDQWTSVPLPVKLLSLLANVLAEMQELRIPDINEDESWEEVNEEEDEEHDENDDDEKKEETFQRSSSKSDGRSVFQPFEEMKHLLTDEVQGGDYQEDPCAATDPINQIDLVSYLTEFLKKLAADDPHYFDLLCQGLAEKDKATVQGALGR